MSHNFTAALDFLLLGGSFGLDAYLAFGPDRNTIDAKRQVSDRQSRGRDRALHARRPMKQEAAMAHRYDDDFDERG